MSLKIRGLVALAGIAATALVASADPYVLEDGVAEDAIGLRNTTYDSVWLNSFSLTGGDTVINQISVAFGTAASTGLPIAGLPVTILLYNDPSGGTPWDGTLAWSLNTNIGAGLGGFENFAVPNIAVGSNFVVGFRFLESRAVGAAGSFPAAFDTTAPSVAGRSFAGFNAPSTSPINLNDLTGSIPAANRGTIEGFGIVGNFLIRANGAVPTPGAAALMGVAGLAGLRRRR